jgi:GT2 family glycosyltransferase
MTSPLARGGRINPSTQHTLSSDERSVGHIPTCNLCLRKKVLEEMNGFDESFVKGQDLELNHRIKKAGYRLLYSPTVTVVHYRKDSFRSFSRQIFKWAKAKVAIIKKHGIEGFVSHVYLWPVYAVLSLLLGFGLFLVTNLLVVFSLLFLFGCISYLGIILSEATRLSRTNKKKILFWYTLLLIPVVHIVYFLGVWNALLKKKIW